MTDYHNNVLSDIYWKIDSNTDHGRFIAILYKLWIFWGWKFILSITVIVFVLPLSAYFIASYYLKSKGILDKHIGPVEMFAFYLLLIFQFVSVIKTVVILVFMVTSNDITVSLLYKELSPYSFSYNHSFAHDIYDKISNIYHGHVCLFSLFNFCIVIILKDILIYKEARYSIFSILQTISTIVIFSIYWIVKIDDNKFDVKYSDKSDARMIETYGDEIASNKDNELVEFSSWPWIIINLVVYIIFGLLHIFLKEMPKIKKTYDEFIRKIGDNINKADEIKKIFNKKDIVDFKIYLPNMVKKLNLPHIETYNQLALSILFGFMPIAYIWWSGNDNVENIINNTMYLVRNYDFFASVTREPWELENIKSFDRIDNIELYIRKYMYINIPREILKDNELSQFAVRFDLLLCSGDISGAEEYLNKCPSEELKLFLKKEIQDRENLLLNHVGISFQKMCNSFAIKEVDGNKEEYVSLVSNRGRITVLSGESGSGKSTINNSIMGDNRFLSSFINGYSSYLLDAPTKKLIPCYSDLFGIDVNNMSLIKNMKIFDRDTNVKELQYLWSYIGIQKYLYKLNREMSVIHFSKGQRDRMKISKIFVSLNSILKKATDTDAILNKRLLNALTSDVSDSELSDISDKIQCSSFMVVLDEPLGALDSGSAIKAMEIVRRYSKLGFSFLIIDHSGIASRYADDIIKIDNKTCEYYTRVNDTMVNIKDLNFENRDTLVIGDTIAYKHKCDKPLEVNKIRQLYKDKQFNSVEICKIDTKTKANLLSILNEHHKNEDKSEVSTNVSDLSDRVNDNPIMTEIANK